MQHQSTPWGTVEQRFRRHLLSVLPTTDLIEHHSEPSATNLDPTQPPPATHLREGSSRISHAYPILIVNLPARPRGDGPRTSDCATDTHVRVPHVFPAKLGWAAQEPWRTGAGGLTATGLALARIFASGGKDSEEVVSK